RLNLMGCTKINKLYNTKVDVDEHFKFIKDSTDNKWDLFVNEGALWMGSHEKNYTMHCRFLTLKIKSGFHFVNCKLLPSTHSTIVNPDRMCLIHSIIKYSHRSSESMTLFRGIRPKGPRQIGGIPSHCARL
ncbi:hypothetical protein J1N35_018865, partial [Gossypium stocksii]